MCAYAQFSSDRCFTAGLNGPVFRPGHGLTPLPSAAFSVDGGHECRPPLGLGSPARHDQERRLSRRKSTKAPPGPLGWRWIAGWLVAGVQPPSRGAGGAGRNYVGVATGGCCPALWTSGASDTGSGAEAQCVWVLPARGTPWRGQPSAGGAAGSQALGLGSGVLLEEAVKGQ